MQVTWKKTKTIDDGEMLFSTIRVSSLEEAHSKANVVIRIIKSHRDDKHSHMSLSSEGLTIALHGASKSSITDEDWSIAKEIQKALND